MQHRKADSGTNIREHAIGLACCLLMLQYALFELSYESFQTNKNRIHRVAQDRFDNGKLSAQRAAGTFGRATHLKPEFSLLTAI